MVQVLNCMKQSCHGACVELHEVMLPWCRCWIDEIMLSWCRCWTDEVMLSWRRCWIDDVMLSWCRCWIVWNKAVMVQVLNWWNNVVKVEVLNWWSNVVMVQVLTWWSNVMMHVLNWWSNVMVQVLNWWSNVMMQVLIAIIIGWLVSAVLTYFDLLSTDRNSVQFYARTDTQLHVIHSTPWLSFPYPGRLPWLRNSYQLAEIAMGGSPPFRQHPSYILVFASRSLRTFSSQIQWRKLFMSLTSNPVLATVRSRLYPRLSELYSNSYLPLWHFPSNNNNSLKTTRPEELSSSRKCSKCCALIVNR